MENLLSQTYPFLYFLIYSILLASIALTNIFSFFIAKKISKNQLTKEDVKVAVSEILKSLQ